MSTHKSYPKSSSHSASVAKKKKKSPTGIFKRGILLGLGLGTIAVISATAGAFIAVSLSTTPLRQSKLTTAEEAVFNKNEAVTYRNLRLPELSRPVHILVSGIKVLTSDVTDVPQEELGYHALVNSLEGLTDALLLIRFDPSNNQMTVLSIPRDTKTEIPEHGFRKINEANRLGGPALTAETVSHLLDGVPIDRYVRINVQGVEKLIDALGGVTVYVPKDMKYTDHSQHLYIDLKQGKQHLDGEKAVQFLRFRYDEFGDIGRVQRQQVLMRAVVEQALKPQTLLKLPDIMGVIQSHVDTNLTIEELLALGGFAGQAKRENVQMLMLPGTFGEGARDYSYWLPYSEKIKTMTAQYFEQGYADVSSYTDPMNLSIAIQDSTEDPEAARAMVRYLKNQGYRHVYVSNTWPEPLKKTEIIAQKGDDLGASAIRAELKVGEILVESTGNLASDITIKIGQDWQAQMMDLPPSY